MSTITLADLKWLPRETLAAKILTSSTGALPASTAIIDVRDSDHIGGHIRGSTWVPSNELDWRTAELVRTLRDKEVVVFHCALSQQRGPSAALRYLREKERLVPEGRVASAGDVVEGGISGGTTQGDDQAKEGEPQRVYVLRGGFTEWQEKYGEDERLTEGYQKDIWEFGY